MGYSNHDKMEWVLIFALEFGRHSFVDEHYDYCHTQSFQSMITDMAEYCHRKGGSLL